VLHCCCCFVLVADLLCSSLRSNYSTVHQVKVLQKTHQRIFLKSYLLGLFIRQPASKRAIILQLPTTSPQQQQQQQLYKQVWVKIIPWSSVASSFGISTMSGLEFHIIITWHFLTETKPQPLWLTHSHSLPPSPPPKYFGLINGNSIFLL